MPSQKESLRPSEVIAYETSQRQIYQVPSEAIEKRFAENEKLKTVIFCPYGEDWEPVTGPSKEQEEAKWNAVELVASFAQAKDDLEHYEYSRHFHGSRPWTEADQKSCLKVARAWNKGLLFTRECTYGLSTELYLNGIRKQGREGMEMVEVESNDFYRREFLQEEGAFSQAELQDMCDLLQDHTTQFALYRKDPSGEESYLTTTSSLPKHRIQNGEAKEEIQKDTGITPDRIIFKQNEVRKRERLPEPVLFEDESDDLDTEWKNQMIRRAKQKQSPRRTGRER